MHKKEKYAQQMLKHLLMHPHVGIQLSQILPILGISKAYFYQIYPSLEDFWKEVLKAFLELLEKHLVILEDHSLPYEEKYKRFLSSHLLMLKKIPHVLIQNIFLKYPSLKKEIHDFLYRYEERTYHFLEEGQKKGFFISSLNPHLIQRIFTAGIRAILDYQFIESTGESFYSLLSQTLYILHKGVLSPQKSVDIEAILKDLKEREDAIYS